jgi:hypothetical protein
LIHDLSYFRRTTVEATCPWPTKQEEVRATIFVAVVMVVDVVVGATSLPRRHTKEDLATR